MDLGDVLEQDLIQRMKQNILSLGQEKCFEITNNFSNVKFREKCKELLVKAARELEEEGYLK